jgi:hypothetical protein
MKVPPKIRTMVHIGGIHAIYSGRNFSAAESNRFERPATTMKIDTNLFEYPSLRSCSHHNPRAATTATADKISIDHCVHPKV